MRSYSVIAEGGLPMLDDIKAKNIGIVRVFTDDTHIDLCYLLPGGASDCIKVGVYVPTRYDLESQETGRRYRVQVLAIKKHRIQGLVHHG